MDFNEWLSINEAKGAFGKQVPSLNSKNFMNHTPNNVNQTSNQRFNQKPINQRNDNQFNQYDQRVQYGKTVEQQILNGLIKCGLEVREPSAKEDMYDKIDGWWKLPQGDIPIQIKYRDTGNDILFEVMKDYQKGVPGRDMIGKAVFYAVLNKNNTVAMVSVAEAKILIKKARDLADVQGFDDHGDFAWGNVTLKLRPDANSGQTKMMAYIPVHALKQVMPPCSVRINY